MRETTTKYIPALRYDRLTAFFDLFMRVAMPEREFKAALLVQADIKRGQRVLDFGVGTATLALMAKQLEPQSEITGIDVDQKIIAIAREKIKAAGLQIGIDQYGGNDLPYPGGHFDKVISSLVFHHLGTKQKDNALKEIKRVLKPNGELHIADWGKAQTMVQRFLFFPVQIFDGFETTADNVRGLLPAFVAEAGFVDVAETKTFSTMFGILSLYRARN